jgi:7-cyano-7-deazaguanine synthase in queuosine biosynthesis
MKVTCYPINSRPPRVSSGSLRIALYGQPNDGDYGCAGSAIEADLRRSGLAPDKTAWDLLSIALSTIAADSAVARADSPDGWTREIDLSIGVENHQVWEAAAPDVERLLRFLTTDIWRISFYKANHSHRLPRNIDRPATRSIVLLSGGLDSLAGAIDLATNSSERPYAVSQVQRGDNENQRKFARANGLLHIQLSHNSRVNGHYERSQRSRSLIFLAFGILVASAMNGYDEGDRKTLFMPENGLISVNPPLTGSRIGSLSTRTAHPSFISSFQRLLDLVKLNVQITNPYQLKTKGEILLECKDQMMLAKLAHLSTSCGRFLRNGYRQCGRCVPCLIRRASFLKWDIKDKTEYVFSDLSTDDKDHARFDDVRSAAMAVTEAESVGFDDWFARVTEIYGENVKQLKAVVKRGMAELAEFLRSQRVI